MTLVMITAKKNDVGNDNSTEVTCSKRDAVVEGELRRRLNGTDVVRRLVDGGNCEIYDYVTFL